MLKDFCIMIQLIKHKENVKNRQTNISKANKVPTIKNHVPCKTAHSGGLGRYKVILSQAVTIQLPITEVIAFLEEQMKHGASRYHWHISLFCRKISFLSVWKTWIQIHSFCTFIKPGPPSGEMEVIHSSETHRFNPIYSFAQQEIITSLKPVSKGARVLVWGCHALKLCLRLWKGHHSFGNEQT